MKERARERSVLYTADQLFWQAVQMVSTGYFKLYPDVNLTQIEIFNPKQKP